MDQDKGLEKTLLNIANKSTLQEEHRHIEDYAAKCKKLFETLIQHGFNNPMANELLVLYLQCEVMGGIQGSTTEDMSAMG